MTPLTLPSNAPVILSQALEFDTDPTKFLLYALNGTIQPSDFEQVCHEAMSHYTKEVYIPEEEWEESGFIKPAPPSIRLAENVHEILNRHIKLVQETPDLEHARIYPFGFVVIESKNWSTDGVTLVFCEHLHDFDDALNDWKTREWRVEECNIEFSELVSTLSDLVFQDEQWKDIKRNSGRPTART